MSSGGSLVKKSEIVVVLTTFPMDADVTTFASTIIREHLSACVTTHPKVQSVYLWEGKIVQEKEQQVVFKTTKDRLEILWNRIRQLHPYEVPEFLVLPIIDGNPAYLNWIRQSTEISN